MLVRFLPLVVAAVCSVATAHAQPALRARLLGGGFTRPIAVVVDPVVPGAVHVVQQDGLVLTFVNGAPRATPFLDLTSVVTEIARRARPARHGVPARCRRHRPRVRQLHQPHRRRQHRGRPLHPQRRRSAGRRPGVALRPDVAGDRRRPPALHHPAVRQPQRRQPGVRPRRLPLHRHGRRRGRRRPRQHRADADDAARQDAAHRRRRATRPTATRIPPDNPDFTHGRSADHQRAAGDLVVRPAQPLALQLRRRRPRRHRRAGHRRRRPGRARGDRLRAGRARRPATTAGASFEGADRQPGDRRADAGVPAGDRAGLRLPHARRPGDHRRLRLSRHRRSAPSTRDATSTPTARRAASGRWR